MKSRSMWAMVAAAGLAVVVSLGGCWPRSSVPEASIIEIELKGLRESAPLSTLRIPMAYLPGLVGWWEPYLSSERALQSPRKTAELELWATWPDLLGRTKDNARQFDDARQSTLWIYVRAVPSTSGDLLLDLESAMKFEKRKALGLVTDDFDPTSEPAAVRGASRHGLNVSGPSPKQLESRRALAYQLLTPVDESSNTFLVCHHEDIDELATPTSGAEVRVVPHCEHYFANPALNAVIKVHYRRAHLSEWDTIERRTNALLARFASTTPRN